MTTPPKSYGQKSIAASLRPRDLMAEQTRPNTWTARVVTLLPEVFPGVLGASLTGKALSEHLWQLQTINLRAFGEGKHRNVDDTPAGGGAGMVLRADIVDAALAEAARGTRDKNWPVLYLSPRGTPLTQTLVQRFAAADGLTLLAGRFEGVDERVLEARNVTEVSLGDFVLTGGEIAAMALIDATVRLLPGVLGNHASVEEESFSNGLLEHPQYTKPAEWEGRPIPDVLLSGHHEKIAQWRREQSEALTKARRPDLWRAFQDRESR